MLLGAVRASWQISCPGESGEVGMARLTESGPEDRNFSKKKARKREMVLE